MTGAGLLTLHRDYDKLSRTRLSPNFILRDFLFSTEVARFGYTNYPSDDVKQVIESGRQLCAKVLEPILEHLGRCDITFGYMSRESIERGWIPEDRISKKRSSSPHQWDRGTFGAKIYARVDVLPFCVEDGLVSRHDFGQWMMHHLDIDLLMQYHQSNVYCVTISPKPRRVWLEWVPWGRGDNESNKVEYMGRDYWQNKFLALTDEEKPKFSPSETSGRMQWPKSALHAMVV